MARSEARLQFGIWDGLEEVPWFGKFVYTVILTDETINHAGVGRLSVSLWAQKAGLSEEDVERGIAALEQEPQIVVDRRTHEILVRTLIRRERIAEQPYLLKAALKAALRTRSPRLRRALADELRKLPPRPPDGMNSAGRPVKYPDPHAAAAELDHQTSDGSPQKGVDTISTPPQEPLDTISTPPRQSPETPHRGGDRSGDGSTPVATQEERSKDFPAQQTIKPDAAAGDGASSPPRKRGSRIPDDFAVDQAMVTWAREHAPNVDGKRETEKFVDYWQSKTGKDATKLDWVATWRNWMRSTEERLVARGSVQSGDPPGWGTSGKKMAKLQALKDNSAEPPLLRALPGGA